MYVKSDEQGICFVKCVAHAISCNVRKWRWLALFEVVSGVCPWYYKIGKVGGVLSASIAGSEIRPASGCNECDDGFKGAPQVMTYAHPSAPNTAPAGVPAPT